MNDCDCMELMLDNATGVLEAMDAAGVGCACPDAGQACDEGCACQ